MERIDLAVFLLVSIFILSSCGTIHYSWRLRTVDVLPRGDYAYKGDNSVWWFYLHASKQDSTLLINSKSTLPFEGTWVQREKPPVDFDYQQEFMIPESPEGKPLSEEQVESGVLNAAVIISKNNATVIK